MSLKNLQTEELYVSIDLETTGLDPYTHDMWEIAILPFNRNYELLPCNFKARMKPMNPISIQQEALNVGNITKEELMSIPATLYQVLNSFYEWKFEMYPEYRFVPCGHSYESFDKNFLIAKMNKYNYDQNFSRSSLDTKILAKRAKFLGYNLPESLSLGSLKKHFNINEKSHTAEGDARTVVKLLKHFEEELKL